MYYYPDLIVSNLFYCTCTTRADVSAPCACLSCSLAFLLLYVVFLSKYMMMIYDDDNCSSRKHQAFWRPQFRGARRWFFDPRPNFNTQLLYHITLAFCKVT